MNIRLKSIIDRRHSDEGMSVVELLVTMMLLGIILLMASNMYISVVKTTDSTQATNEGTRIASNAMNEVNRVVRFAIDNPQTGTDPLPAIAVAKATEVVLFSLVDADGLASTTTRPIKPVMVKFALESDGNIVERRWDPTASGQFWNFGTIPPVNSTAARSRVLGGKFLATGTETSLLRYLKADGTEMIPTGSSSLSLAQRQLIASVVVTMNTVPLVGPDDHPVIVTNTIGMLNLVKNTGGDGS